MLGIPDNGLNVPEHPEQAKGLETSEDASCQYHGERGFRTVRQVVPEIGLDGEQWRKAERPQRPFFHRVSVCDALSRRYMLKPPPGHPVNPLGIPREYHGVCHSNRTVLWALVLLGLLKQQGHEDALTFTPGQLDALIKAALLHDAGREGEGEDLPEWELESGNLCQQHLLAIGHDMLQADYARGAIIEKNTRRRADKMLFDRLLHDADCLEVMRVRGEFELSYLDLYTVLGRDTCYHLASQVRDVISRQSDLHMDCLIIDHGQQIPGERRQGSSSMGAEARAIKGRFERADRPFLKQLSWLKAHSPSLYEHIANVIGEVPETLLIREDCYERLYFILRHEAISLEPPFFYTDEHSGRSYRAKDCSDHMAAARNEVLMTKLAGLSGLRVPDLRLISHGGRALLFSDMTGFTSAGLSLSTAFRARLYVVCAWLGHNRIGEQGAIGMNSDQQPVIMEWHSAGEFNGPEEGDRKQACFNATVEELKDFDSLPLFSDLTRQDKIDSIRWLCESSAIQETGSVVECFGPDEMAHRHRLRRTLCQRLAYLNRRFPESCAEGCLSLAEQVTIAACGVNGYSVPASFRDIQGGDLRFYGYQGRDGAARIACQLTLNPNAANQLSDRFGVPDTLSDKLYEILQFVFLQVPEKKLCKFDQVTRAIQSEADRQKEACAEIRHALVRMHKSGQLVEENTGVLNSRLAFLSEAEAFYGAVASMTVGEPLCLLTEYIDKDLVICEQRNPDCRLKVLQSIRNENAFLKGLIIFPPRVSSASNEREEEAGGFWIKKHQRYGYGFKTEHLPEKTVPEIDNCLTCRADDLGVHYGDGGETGITVQWKPRLQSTGGVRDVLKLSMTGDAYQAGRLLTCLAQLGIDIRRPGLHETQSFYQDQVSRLPGERQTMLEGMTPRWEDNHSVENGRLILYYPPETFMEQSLPFKLCHVANFVMMDEQYSGYAGGRLDLLLSLMHSGEVLCSMAERLRIGVNSGQWYSALAEGGGDCCYAAVNPDHSTYLPDYAVILKPKVFRRTDVAILLQDNHGAFSPQVHRLSIDNYLFNTLSELSEGVRNRIDEFYRENPGASSRPALLDLHELLFQKGISFNEIESVRMPGDAKLEIANSRFVSDMGVWPDGRDMAEVTSTQMSLREHHKAEIRKKSVSAYLGIEQGMPLKAFKALIESGGCPNFTPEWMESFSLIVFLFGGGAAKPMAFQALHHQRTDIFCYLLHLPQFDSMNKYNRFSLIHYAVYVKNTEAVRQLLLTQPDIDRELFPDHRDVSLIKRVLDSGPEILRIFLDRKVFLPDAVFSRGWGFSTPLLHCSENNTEMHAACAKRLLLHGAKPNLMMRDECITPLVKAYKAGNTQLMSLLLGHNANVEWVDSSGMNFIGRLINDGQWTLIQKLELIDPCRKVLAHHIKDHILDEAGGRIVSQLVTNDDWYLIERLGVYLVCRNYWLQSREAEGAESSFSGESRWCILL